MKKKLLTVLIFLTLAIEMAACGRMDADKQASSNEIFEKAKADKNTLQTEDSETETNSPLTITYTDKDYITVQVKKELFDPENADFTFYTDFLDADDNFCMGLVLNGKGENCYCEIYYGERGDVSKTIVSDYGEYEDLGDSVLFEIFLCDPDIQHAVAQNNMVPIEVFERPVTCMYYDKDDNARSFDTNDVLVFEFNEEKRRNDEKINELLYTCDSDVEYLTPASDDYRVEIYDIPKVLVYRTCVSKWADKYKTGIVFGTDPLGTTDFVNVRLIRLVEYDNAVKRVARTTAYTEKIEFPEEMDALNIKETSFYSGLFRYYFETDKDFEIDKFDPYEGLKTMCDELMPTYYKGLCAQSGIRCETVRDGNTYYQKYYGSYDVNLDDFNLRSYVESGILGCKLDASGPEFSADNCGESAVASFTKTYEYALPFPSGIDDYNFTLDNEMGTGEYQVTVYYSKPHKHIREINYGESGGSGDKSLPEGYVTVETDSAYFSPSSDDYIIFYEKMDCEMPCNEKAVIVSFNEEGNIVDAKYRIYKPDNMVNPMEELIDDAKTAGYELLYSEDNIAYFDMIDCRDFKRSEDDGSGTPLYTKQELIDNSIDETMFRMPGNNWSGSYAIYISQK